MAFDEQRRGPSRQIFSRVRACPCPRLFCHEKPMPAAHAVVLGPEVPPAIHHNNSAQCTGPRKPMIDPVGVAGWASRFVGAHVVLAGRPRL